MPESETPKWVSVHTVDEMEAFYKEILPQIRVEAKYHGYAIGLHGSMRRDLDLIAVPWSDDHSDKDELARAIQEAACGMPQMVYQWNTKPCGRMSVSIPVCWPEWPEEIGDGHIDLSVLPDLTTALSLAQTEIKGHMRVVDELKERAARVADERDFLERNYKRIEAKLAEAQSRIAELEKVLVSLLAFPFEIEKLERGSKEWAAAMAEHGEVLEAAQILVGAVGSLKSRA